MSDLSHHLPDDVFRHPSELEDEGVPDHEGPLVSKHLTGDGQEGVSPPADRPIASLDFGTTAEERREGESLDGRLRRELPDRLPTGDPYPVGRLVEPDEGLAPDEADEAVAFDAGPDSGGFSAEELAIHVIPDSET